MVGGDDGEVVLSVSVQEGDVTGEVVVDVTPRDGSATCKIKWLYFSAFHNDVFVQLLLTMMVTLFD